MSAPKTAWLPGPSHKGEAAKEGAEVSKKPRLRPRKNVPEPCKPAATAAEFFLPASKKTKHRREPQAQANVGRSSADVECGAADGEVASNAKNKRSRKEKPVSIAEDAAPEQRTRPGKSSTEPAKDPPAVSKPVVGLWEERKLAAEEDARRSAGKQIHPFFTRQIAAKIRPAKLGDMSSSKRPRTYSQAAGQLLSPCRPMHVTQYEEEERAPLDWGVFRLLDVGLGSGGTQNSEVPEVPEAISLCIREWSTSFPALDKIIGHFSSVILSRYPEKRRGTEQHPRAPEKLEDMLLQYLHKAELPFQEVSWIQQYCQAPGKSLSKRRLRKRADSFKARRIPEGVFPSAANSLWTEVYNPSSPQDVCGNVEAVAFVNSWLGSWRNKILGGGGSRENKEESDTDDDKNWFQDDSGDENDSDSEESLVNTLLLTGPVGCGKTATVYACAKSHGFAVIEVSSADLRNGALIKQKYGEALESHRFPDWAAGVKSTSVLASRPSLTFLLFEDVDVVFDEDRGLPSALAKLAATSKRPIILTSNKRCPILPLPLLRLTREFKQPCTQVLVLQACLASAAGGYACCPQLMECLVKACRHDMRQVMMMLQFWTQGPSRLCSESNIRKEEAVGFDHGKDRRVMEVPNGSASSSVIEEVRCRGRWNDAQDSGVQDPRRSILLPLSHPFSLTGHLARKVSEAAWQLHLCASYAGVMGSQDGKLKVTSSQVKVPATSSSDQDVALVSKSRMEGEGISARLPLCKSPGKAIRPVLETMARPLKLQRVSNISSLSESWRGSEAGPKHQGIHVLDSASVETVGSSCWCKAAAGDKGPAGGMSRGLGLDGGHSCLDDLYKPAVEMSGSVSSGGAELGSRTSAAGIGQCGNVPGKPVAPQVQGSLGVVPQRMRRRLCKLRDLKNPVAGKKVRTLAVQSETKATADGGLPTQVSASPVESSSCGAIGEKQEDGSIFLALGSEVMQRRTETDETARVPGIADSEKQCVDGLSGSHDQEPQIVSVLEDGTGTGGSGGGTSEENDSVAEVQQLANSQSCGDAVGVLDTLARLTDALSVFDTICSHSARELQASPSLQNLNGFHLDSLEDEGTYLADCSVRLCLEQCSELLNWGCAEKDTQEPSHEPRAAEIDLTSLDWLGSDANPCDADQIIRREARKASLRNIVFDVLPRRTKILATGAALYDYSACLARICKLEQSRRAATASDGVVTGSRRRGRRFRHYLGDVAEPDLACLLSHSELRRGWS